MVFDGMFMYIFCNLYISIDLDYWAIPENIHTPRRMAFWNSGGKGGSLNWNSEGKEGLFALEFRRHGGALTSGILKA